MRSSTLIVSYLWKDTFSRWLEQPSSLLARLFVGLLLAVVATVILVAFNLLERSLRERLERFGLNTVVVREMISSTDPGLTIHGEAPDPLSAFDAWGERARLRQLYVRATTEFQSSVPVVVYHPDTVGGLAEWLTPDYPIVYVTERLPEFALVKIDLGEQSLTAAVRAPGDFFQPLGLNELVLVPRGTAQDAERVGFVAIDYFRRASVGPPMERFVTAIGELGRLDRQSPPQVQSALGMAKELEELRVRQQQWRTLLAGGLGLTLALVYGAIAVLEFRQNLYITALLRSLGASRSVLYLRQWLENGLLANAAAGSAIFLVFLFHREIFGTLGFSRSVLDFAEGNPYWSVEILLILLWVNVGAFLSSLPVAVGLRRPVGKVLN